MTERFYPWPSTRGSEVSYWRHAETGGCIVCGAPCREAQFTQWKLKANMRVLCCGDIDCRDACHQHTWLRTNGDICSGCGASRAQHLGH